VIAGRGGTPECGCQEETAHTAAKSWHPADSAEGAKKKPRITRKDPGTRNWGRTAAAVALAVTAAAVVVLLGACGSADKPPDMAYGRDVCAECHMIISEARFAAAYRMPDGTERKFDDIGDMVAFGVRQDQLGDAKAWVHDFETEEWLDAKSATYVVGDVGSSDTPMGRNVFAFSDRSAAESAASGRDAKVVTWDDLVASPPSPGTTATTGSDMSQMTMPQH